LTKGMARNTSFPERDSQDEYHPLIAIWILRALSRFSVYREFFDHKTGQFNNDDIANFLGMDDMAENKLKPKAVHLHMARLLKSLEPQEQHERGNLFANIDHLVHRMTFNLAERRILAFAVLLKRFGVLDDAIDYIHATTESRFAATLSHILNLPSDVVLKALSRSGTLIASGLTKIEEGYKNRVDLEPMSDLCDALFATETGEDALLRHFLVPANSPSLSMTDFPHIRQDVKLLSELVTEAIKRKEKGVNILIYGPPGTGKTELARVLAKKAKARLFEVKAEDKTGEPLKSDRRLDAYRFCQQMLAKDSSSIILFDEVEDVFSSRGFSLFGMEFHSGENKGWINKALEQNRTPAVWICNRLSQIDPAFLRRFDYSLELRTPPRSVRLNIARKHLKGLPVSQALLERLAVHEQISPAQMAKAARVVQLTGHHDKESVEGILEKTLERSVKAMGQNRLPKSISHSTDYSLEYLNTNADITLLINGLKTSRRGRLCFYGPPGTGKTALAGHIASQIDGPLLCKRASDLLSKWVGENEKNIAAMFEQACDEDAVLVLDEADSFLQDRLKAHHSWEITQVNELLTQMENFEGLFICTTNQMDKLDQASLRRFDLKIRFDYLLPDQVWELFCQEIGGNVSENERHHIQLALQKLGNLTPGDFATVKRQQTFFGSSFSPPDFLDALKKECQAKWSISSRPIGFLE